MVQNITNFNRIITCLTDQDIYSLFSNFRTIFKSFYSAMAVALELFYINHNFPDALKLCCLLVMEANKSLHAF